jgi:hypothetical protein
MGVAICTEEIRNAYRILVGKPKGQVSLWRNRHKFEDKTTSKLNGMEIGFRGVN